MMKEKIIDYLILQCLLDKTFQSNPNQRIKAAYLLAKSRYKNLSEEGKEEIIKEIQKWKKGKK